MDTLRHLALSAGRGLALLAAMMLVLLPALPAHAHAHLSATMAAGHDHGQDDGRSYHHQAKLDPSASAAADRDGSGSLPQQAGDCCFVCHVSVLPAVHAVPLPPSHLRTPPWGADGHAPPDALSERLPEPPRPFA